MDAYLLTLYGHFLSLVAAVAASAILHFNFVRLRRAANASEARAAVETISKTAPVMPGVALALLLTGLFLAKQRWGFDHGWIAASVVGLISMPVSALVTLKPRLAKLGQMLGGKTGPIDADASALIYSRALAGAMYTNHAMAILIMFVMVAKPSGLVSTGILLLAPIFGVLSSRGARATARQEALAG